MISVVILTKNSSKTISRTLQSLKEFDEVVIYDTGSTDNTLKIVRNFENVKKVIKAKFQGFGKLRNLAASYAKNDFILALDSDEVLPQPLVNEIKALKLDENTGYEFLSHNFFNGKHIKCCGWHPRLVVRMYNRKKTCFDPSKEVHEVVIIKNLKIHRLKNPLFHYPYRSISDFLEKMQKYSDLFAIQNRHKKSSSYSKAVFHGFFAFFKSYFLKKGIFYGKEGFFISFYNANTAFYKYLKLMEINKS